MSNEEKEKYLVYFAVGVIVIIILIMIIMIWKPTFSKAQNNGANTYNQNLTYEKMMTEYYSKYLGDKLKITNYDELYEKIDENYLNEIGITEKEAVRNYLKENQYISTSIGIKNINYYSDGFTNYYRVEYTSQQKNLYLNVIESSPYNFVVNFSQDSMNSLISVSNTSRTKDDVTYNFELLESTVSSIGYKITIINNSTNTYDFDFSSLNSIQLRYDYVNYVNMAAVANSSSQSYTIAPGGSNSIEVLFNLSFDNQINIDSFVFNTAKVDGSNQIIEVNV